MIFILSAMVILIMASWVLLTSGTVPMLIWAIIGLLFILGLLTA